MIHAASISVSFFLLCCSCFWWSSAAATTQLAKSSSFVAAFLPTKRTAAGSYHSMATTSDQRRGHRIENDGLGRQQQQPTTAFGLTHHCRNAHTQHTEVKFCSHRHLSRCSNAPTHLPGFSAVLIHLYWSLRRYPTKDEPPRVSSFRADPRFSFRFVPARQRVLLSSKMKVIASFPLTWWPLVSLGGHFVSRSVARSRAGGRRCRQEQEAPNACV
jgi:hypothetical protein